MRRLGIDEGNVRLTANPTAVPKAIGNTMEAAGLAKMAAGSVREGMKVVMMATGGGCQFSWGISSCRSITRNGELKLFINSSGSSI